MRKSNLIQRLEKEGYPVKYDTFSYWNEIPYIERADGTQLFLTIYYHNKGNSKTIGYDSRLITYDLVMEAFNNICDCLLSVNEDWKPFSNTKKIRKAWENY